MTYNAANKQEATGPSGNQICICTVEYILITRNKKFISNNHTNQRVTQAISAGLLSFVSDYSHSTCSFCWNVLGQGPCIIDDVLIE
jgi:hypothetical protein